MRERSLGPSGLRVTELGFGAASLGNLYVASSDETARAAVDAAWDGGIRYFDTAPHYGLGLSERRLGAALRDRPREDFLLSTKVGRLLVPNETPTERDGDLFEVPGDLRREWDFSRDGVLRSIEQSLDRLGLDRIDIAYLHDPDASGVADAAVTGAAALLELRDQGVVRAVGVGSNDAETVATLLRTTDIDTAMLAGRDTLLDHGSAERVLEAAGERSIVAVGVFNSGILASARPERGARFDYAEAASDVLERARAIADVADRERVTLPQLALAFPLRSDHVASCTVGMRTAEEVRRNLELIADPPPERVWGALADAGLLD